MNKKRVSVFSDSALMVNQLNGSFRVKDAKLKPLYAVARELADAFEYCGVSHVMRGDNERADELANAAMDKRDTVGSFEVAPAHVIDLVHDAHSNLFDQPEDISAVLPPHNLTVENAMSDEEETVMAHNSAESEGVYSLTVKAHFDAAHHLYDYPGECRELHGHTWDIEATVESRKLNDIGIVYDFKDLKDDLNRVLEAYDHKLLNDIVPFDEISPTAENLARIIYRALQKRVDSTVKVAEVAVWESPIARVGYRE
jgi:6-pyruvoyltetrahydropterin/6-carboxytetrahydropterin synthase